MGHCGEGGVSQEGWKSIFCLNARPKVDPAIDSISYGLFLL